MRNKQKQPLEVVKVIFSYFKIPESVSEQISQRRVYTFRIKRTELEKLRFQIELLPLVFVRLLQSVIEALNNLRWKPHSPT